MAEKDDCQCEICKRDSEIRRLKDALGLKRAGEHMHGIDVCAYCAEGDLARQRVPKLEAENARLRALLERSLRLDVKDVAGVRVTSFYIGESHLIAEWGDSDGVASDNVFVEKPALEYGVTTTPTQRCQRMVFEMVHWPLVCAMLAGPGDGELKTAYDQGVVGDDSTDWPDLEFD